MQCPSVTMSLLQAHAHAGTRTMVGEAYQSYLFMIQLNVKRLVGSFEVFCCHVFVSVKDLY